MRVPGMTLRTSKSLGEGAFFGEEGAAVTLDELLAARDPEGGGNGEEERKEMGGGAADHKC